jgi:hypothetical protein
MIVIDEKFLVIKEINGYLVDMILINSFWSGSITYYSKKTIFFVTTPRLEPGSSDLACDQAL